MAAAATYRHQAFTELTVHDVLIVAVDCVVAPCLAASMNKRVELI